MKRALTALFITTLCALTGVSTAFAEGATVSFSPATVQVDAGGHFETDVVVSTDTFTRGIQFGLTYDPRLIHIEQLTDGDFYQSWASAHSAQAATVIRFTPDNTAGHVSIGGMAIFGGPDDGPVGSGVVQHIEGSAVPGASGTATLEFESLLVSGMAIAIKPLNAGSASIGVSVPVTKPAEIQPVPARVHELQPAVTAEVDTSALKETPFDVLMQLVLPLRTYLPLAILIAGSCATVIVYRGISSAPIRDSADKSK